MWYVQIDQNKLTKQGFDTYDKAFVWFHKCKAKSIWWEPSP